MKLLRIVWSLSLVLPAVMAMTAGQVLAEQTFTVGQHVTFQDNWNRYGGGTISAVVIQDRGPGFVSRYTVRIDKKVEAAFQENSFKGDELEALGPAPAAQGQAAARSPNPAAQQAAQPMPQQAAPPVANPAARPAAGNAHNAGHWGNPPPPPRGSFRYGKPNLQTMIGRKATVPPGSQEYFVGTPPGDESCIGRWYTRTGGTWTAAPGNKGDAYDKLIWGNPEVSELINVLPNGTWEMNDHGTVTRGKWYDIGFNAIRLINMDDGCDWTASVYDKMIQFKGYNGITKEGNRY